MAQCGNLIRSIPNGHMIVTFGGKSLCRSPETYIVPATCEYRAVTPFPKTDPGHMRERLAC